MTNPRKNKSDPPQAPESRGTSSGSIQPEGAGPWLLPLLLCAVLVGVLLYSQPWAKWGQPGSGRSEGIAAGTTPPGDWVPVPRPAGKTVALTIDFGNGATREFSALPWRDGMTVADLMEAARHFRPSIRYTQKGTGAQAFLTALEGMAHQASSGKFWFYEINGKRGIRSFGIQPLISGDRVLWTFGPEE